jgi:hypothetical protein
MAIGNSPGRSSAHVLSLIGYWEDPATPPDQCRGLPNPRDLVSSLDDKTHRTVVKHLRQGTVFRAFMGTSRCRFCAKDLGSREFSDGVFAWPEGLDHYVHEHHVRLPDAFVQTCAAPSQRLPDWLRHTRPELWIQVDRETAVPAERGAPSSYLVDESPWLDWAALNTPAYPAPSAIPLAAARDVCRSLSHDSWQAQITEVNQRWCLRVGGGGAETRIYVHKCGRDTLERRLPRLRSPDPAVILEPERTRIIAAEYDGTWGAARVLAANKAAWLVLVKEPDAAWPTSDYLDDMWRRIEPGRVVFTKYGRFFVMPAMDELAWRWFITSERETSEQAI